MQSLWNDAEAASCQGDPLKLRVYTSRLLGRAPDLVLHGGGNTSVKTIEPNLFGEEEEIIHVKGSGWDLATIEAEGFAPVRLAALQKLAELPALDDLEMVRQQRMAMTDPGAPNPSVEAILHAIIPFRFVDHTHADAVVTISNTPDGEQRIRALFGDTVLVVPYVMPGFILAREIYERTKDLDWSTLQGIILLNHGVFTFDDDARASYEQMIALVTRAEEYLDAHAPQALKSVEAEHVDPLAIAKLRRRTSALRGRPVLVCADRSEASVAFSRLEDVADLVSRGPLTPDHIIRTKRTPVVLTGDHQDALDSFAESYAQYFKEYASEGLQQLDPAPRWAVWPGHGTISFGPTPKDLRVINDITRHTMHAIHRAEQLGGWQALPQKDLFAMEYWILEQAKLKKAGKSKPIQGRVALVTGAASGIGRACVHRLVEDGAVVIALDIDKAIHDLASPDVLPLTCDVTNAEQLRASLENGILHFGGLDMLISNAGVFPPSASIEQLTADTWNRSLEINLNSHRQLLQLALPYLEYGIDPSVVFVGTKNVAAPGPGASAYSVAKAGLVQLARIAALELGEKGIRVNTVHPNAVFDTGIWSEDVLRTRAEHYGMSVEEYKTNNVLGTQVTSADVTEMIVAMLGPAFAKTTGAEVPIDGGNDRVI